MRDCICDNLINANISDACHKVGNVLIFIYLGQVLAVSDKFFL